MSGAENLTEMFTCGESGEKIVTSDRVHNAGDKYSQREVLSDVGFAINKPVSVRELHEVGKPKS